MKRLLVLLVAMVLLSTCIVAYANLEESEDNNNEPVFEEGIRVIEEPDDGSDYKYMLVYDKNGEPVYVPFVNNKTTTTGEDGKEITFDMDIDYFASSVPTDLFD